MEIIRNASAGTLESNDILVMISPAENDIDLQLESIVFTQFGEQIRQTTLDTLRALGVQKAHITLNDRGALDCTIRARVEAAVLKGASESEGSV